MMIIVHASHEQAMAAVEAANEYPLVAEIQELSHKAVDRFFEILEVEREAKYGNPPLTPGDLVRRFGQ